MGSDELIANLFRISQTEQKLKKEEISSEYKANEVHFEVGKNIVEAQCGESRAKYGDNLIKEWSKKLTNEFGID